MLSPTTRQASLFFVAFAQQASLIKDDLLDPVDALLNDPALIGLVADALARRAPLAATRGRPSIAPDRLLRSCALKHIKGWSLRQLERELRASLVFRRFTRFDEAPIPKHSTFCRDFAALGDVTFRIHDRVVAMTRTQRVALGRRLRTDTTVVETNVHYPTDSTLLQDGIRVLSRSMRQLVEECQAGAVHIADHGRSVKHRVLEIHRAAKALTEANRERLKDSYGKLVGIARRVLGKARKITRQLERGELPILGSVGRVLAADLALRHFTPLVAKVIAQTEARVFGGDRHVEGKVLSLFEEHTEVICKGKAHKPSEFGRLVRIDEVENGIVSGFEVETHMPNDSDAWEPALDEHQRQFGRPPRMATGDRGFHSAKNERLAEQRGVKRVALPARGRLSPLRARLQKQRWFRRALRWRAGIESRIATLKHRFGMARAQYKGARGFHRYVGWCVIAHNLVATARVQCRREADARAQ